MRSNKNAEFDAVYSSECDSIFYRALGYVKNPHTAEDIMQEVFLRYHLYKVTSGKEIPKDSTKKWLRAVCRNLSLNYIRDHHKEVVCDIEEYASQFAEPELNPEYLFFEHLWESERMAYSEKILGALMKKNAKWYHAIMYAYCLGKKRQEVAAVMGITEDALDGLLRRAKNWIMENYKEEFDRINYK